MFGNAATTTTSSVTKQNIKKYGNTLTKTLQNGQRTNTMVKSKNMNNRK